MLEDVKAGRAENCAFPRPLMQGVLSPIDSQATLLRHACYFKTGPPGAPDAPSLRDSRVGCRDCSSLKADSRPSLGLLTFKEDLLAA